MTGRPRDPSLDMNTWVRWKRGGLGWMKMLHCAILSWPLLSADRTASHHVPFLFVLLLCPGQLSNETLLIIDTVSPIVEPLSKQTQGFAGAEYRHEGKNG